MQNLRMVSAAAGERREASSSLDAPSAWLPATSGFGGARIGVGWRGSCDWYRIVGDGSGKRRRRGRERRAPAFGLRASARTDRSVGLAKKRR